MNDPLDPLINALHRQGRLRVWSLVITIFGDLVQHRGGEISTARLGQLLTRVGIEQGTLRTALSRLGRDGWVTSVRKGRTSLYRLSPEGTDRFAPATSQIYAAPMELPIREWAVSVDIGAGGAQTVRITPAAARDRHTDLCVVGALADISEAFRASLLVDDHREQLIALHDDLAALTVARIEDPLDAAAARILLIHRWRRLTLRYPDIAPELVPDDVPIKNPRLEVARLYCQLSELTELWLDSALGDIAPMPPADERFLSRFGGAKRA